MDSAQQTVDEMAAIYFRAEDLARRTVEYHRVRETEHRSRERFGRRFRPFPWSEAVEVVLSDEALEDEASVVALIRELGRQGCSEVALAALDLVVTRGSPAPTKAMFDAALLVCATEYQDQRCLELYNRLRNLGLSPDLGTANLLLTGLCCRGRLEEAVGVLADMRKQMGIRPNSYSVLMVLQACNYKRRGAYREAIDAVQALEAGGRTANEEVIEALLQVCEAAMQHAPSFEAALAVFSALSELHLADCTRVYNGLLGAAGREGRWREAQALFAQMQEDDVPASLETHTALIQASVVGRALDHALQIFEQLVAGRSAHEAVPASITTYNHLIHACHQAGMLEKALEIASWVQKTGVEFDDETYGELMATIDVAQLWDDKALKQARQEQKVVLPRNLRPAPYDAMRVMYLDHLEVLQEEELLAMEKLGGLGSWASKSLTRGVTARPSSGLVPPTPAASLSVTSSARSLARSIATTSAPSLGYDVELGYGFGYGTAAWRNNGGAALPPTSSLPPAISPINTAISGQGPWFSPGPGAGAGGGTGPATSFPPSGALAAERSGASTRAGSPVALSGPHGSAPPQLQSRAASVKQLLKTLSTRPLPVLGSGGVGGMSFRAAASGSAAPPPVPAPTGYHDPPAWAQVQTMDAATAGPGGTPYSAAVLAVQGSSGAAEGAADQAAAAASPMAVLTLAVEPANLYGQSSVSSLGGVPSRTSVRSMTLSNGGGGGGGGGGGTGSSSVTSSGAAGSLRVMLPSSGASLASSVTALPSGTLPPLTEAQSLVLGATNSSRSEPSTGAGPPPPARHRSRAAWGLPSHSSGPDGSVAAALSSSTDFVPSPLPALSSMSVPVPGGGPSRRFSMAVIGK